MGYEVGGVFGLIVLLLDIWAIIQVAQSSAGNFRKVIWIAIILFLPVLGLLVWWLIGPKP